jgi:L-asparaginase
MQPVFSVDGGHPSAAAPVLAVLGMGGTIAGRAASPHDVVGYQAGVVPVADLVAGMAPPVGWRVQAQQVANVDSKDMTVALWQALLGAVHARLQQPEVGAIVVTHGTDTLEETAWLLQTVLQPAWPVVLVGAMRPASALAPDGPQNLADALTLAVDRRLRAAGGVWVTLAGRVFAARTVTKVHPTRADAFGGGDAGPAAWVEAGRVRWVAPPAPLAGEAADPRQAARVQAVLAAPRWPRVEWIASHGGADGALVRALLRQRREAMAGRDADDALAGLVVAGTGNGSLHEQLAAALAQAQDEGVAVWVTTRCPQGEVVPGEGGRAARRFAVTDLPPPKARVSLSLQLLWQAAGLA